MTDDHTPSGALDELAAQHAGLRDLMERCEELADEVDAGTAAPIQLLRKVARLRIAFEAHNRREEQLLSPLWLDADWLGAVRVSRMVEDHVLEHREMQLGLRATPTAELRGVLASLREHLDTEERYRRPRGRSTAARRPAPAIPAAPRESRDRLRTGRLQRVRRISRTAQRLREAIPKPRSPGGPRFA